MWMKRNPGVLLVRMKTDAATVENSTEVPQKLKVDLSYDVVIALLGTYPTYIKTLIQRNICTPMLIAAKITKLWKQLKCPLIGEWTKKWYIYSMEYYSPIKNNEILPFATTWVDLESIKLNKISEKKTNTV